MFPFDECTDLILSTLTAYDSLPAKRKRKSSEQDEEEQISQSESNSSKLTTEPSEPRPTTSKDTSEGSAVPPCDLKADQKDTGSESSSDNEEKESGSSEKLKVQGRRNVVPKEKPTLLDYVVKNMETIFRMIKK